MALNPFLSSGFRKSMLDGNAGVQSLFDGGELHIYSGTQPADADTTEGAGSVLATVLLPDFTEEVLDGDMSVPGSWTAGSGWAIAAGVATATTSTADLDQTPATALISGVEYVVTFTISNLTGGTCAPILGSTVGTTRSGNGTFTELIVAGAGATHGVRALTSLSCDIDDFSVKIHAFEEVATLASIALNGTWSDPSADASGTAAWYRLYDSAVTTGASTTAIRIDGTVGVGATFDLDISSTTVTIVDLVNIPTFTIDLLATDSV